MAKTNATQGGPARAKTTPNRVSAVSKGHRTVTPYLTLDDGAGALAWAAVAHMAKGEAA